MLGNYLGKARQNAVFGIRTPWTLSDARVWDKTHRAAGRLMVLAGLALIPVSLLVPETVPLVAVMVTLTAGPLIWAALYSRSLWRAPAPGLTHPTPKEKLMSVAAKARTVVLAIAVALAILAYGQGLWGLLAFANVAVSPAVPWAGPVMAAPAGWVSTHSYPAGCGREEAPTRVANCSPSSRFPWKRSPGR